MTLELVRSRSEFHAACERLRAASARGFALVPTMGALHAGHRALMRRGQQEAAAVAVTIFVNPTQFGPGEDFTRYPRDLEADLAECTAEGVALVFAPEPGELYLPGDATRVFVQHLTEGLCGGRRPGHFEGVATIVTKLFQLAGPCTAVFGRKDYQQLKVVECLARDLFLPVRVVGHPTLRDGDGLALSSRNRYLSPVERAQALALPRALARVAERYAAGERAAAQLKAAAAAVLGSVAVGSVAVGSGGSGSVAKGPVAASTAELRLEYLELLGAEDLGPISGDVRAGQAGVFVAARVGNTRLIDNHIIGVDEPPLEGQRAASGQAPSVRGGA